MSDDIWTTYPTAVCYAYDAYPRRLALFTGAAAFHPAVKRWLPVGDSQRIEGPLEGTTQDLTAGTLTIKPGHEERVNQALAKAGKFVAGVGSHGDGQRKDPIIVVGHH